jgi:hypothetical protein
VQDEPRRKRLLRRSRNSLSVRVFTAGRGRDLYLDAHHVSTSVLDYKIDLVAPLVAVIEETKQRTSSLALARRTISLRRMSRSRAAQPPGRLDHYNFRRDTVPLVTGDLRLGLPRWNNVLSNYN